MVVTDAAGERDQVERLFTALAANRLDEFLLGCSDRMLITLRGTGTTSTILSRSEVPAWWEGLHSLADGSLSSHVVLTMTASVAQVVILRHTFVLEGRSRRYDTVNCCTLHQGTIAAWFSRPLDLADYAEAWGMRTTAPTRSARSGSRASIPLVHGPGRS